MERKISFTHAVLGLILLTLGAVPVDAVVYVDDEGEGLDRASRSGGASLGRLGMSLVGIGYEGHIRVEHL